MAVERHAWKNISFALATLLLWASARFFDVRVLKGTPESFRPFDVLFIILPPLGAFFLNWYWMREQRTDTIVKWAVSWSGIDLLIFILAMMLLGNPLHQFIISLP